MPKIAIEEIQLSQFHALVELFHQGFPQVAPAVWETLRDRLTLINRPQDYSHIGYSLVVDGQLVGAILVFFSERDSANERIIIGNVSSWYVAPAYRSLSVLMIKKLSTLKEVILTNYSPIPAVVPLFRACGFSNLSAGLEYVPPLCNPKTFHRNAALQNIRRADLSNRSELEKTLLEQHLSLDCEGVLLQYHETQLPILWLISKRKALSIARIIYCPNKDVLTTHAEDLNWYLLKKGIVGFTFDTDSKTNLRCISRHDTNGKLVRGNSTPVLLDLAYSERVLLFDLL